MLELLNTEGWLKYIGDRQVRTIKDAEAYIQKITLNKNASYFVCVQKDNEIPVGAITFIKREYLESPDIGFAFLPAYAGKGYAYEAAKKVLDEMESAGTIHAITMKTNDRSIKLIEKLGLQFDKEIKVNDEMLQLYTSAEA